MAGIDRITSSIIGSAIHVHRERGPGLLESTYEACLASILVKRGHCVERQLALPVIFGGEKLECGYRLDVLVDRCVVVELKTAAGLEPVHLAQMMTYLRFFRDVKSAC